MNDMNKLILFSVILSIVAVAMSFFSTGLLLGQVFSRGDMLERAVECNMAYRDTESGEIIIQDRVLKFIIYGTEEGK